MKEPSFKIVYFNFDDNPEEYRLIQSAEKFGYKIEKIGQGKGFINFRQAKIDVLLEELSKVEEEYTMFTDGLDSWFLRPNILEVYLNYFKGEVVVSGNRDHYPSTNMYDMEEFPESPTSFRFICCSQFIGKTKDIIHTLEVIRDSWNGFTDQEGWHVAYVRNLSNIMVDYNCRLFLNMTNVSLKELDSNFKLEETGIIPCSIHWGGPKGDSPNGIAMKECFRYWSSL